MGNAPELLQWDLTSLHSPSLCVVGVNRAHVVLPSPTAFLFLDRCLDEECHVIWRDSGALVVGPAMYSGSHYVRPRIVYGDAGWDQPLHAHTIYVDGNSGVAAARWALSLGFAPVWLLGISAMVEPGDSDFAGATFSEGTARSMTRQATQLLQRHGDVVRRITTPDELQDAIDDAHRHDTEKLRGWIRGQTEIH